jgi:hypothetical protein
MNKRIFDVIGPARLGAVLLGLALQACASGGGGGSVVVQPPEPPPPPPPPPPEAAYETAEYRAQYGLGLMNTSHAYANGAFGEGVTIAVIDSGIDDGWAELQGRLHPASTSIWEEQGGTLGDYGSSHGTAIAAVIAAARNDIGMHGVAPETTLLDIRVDRGEPNTVIGGSFPLYTETDLALSIDYAVDNGARIISLSLARPPSAYENGGADIYAALRRAVDAGVLITIGTANYSGDVPVEDRIVGDWLPAAFADDPTMNGQIVVVPALNSDGELASFSARAGILADFAISAAGEEIFVSLDADTTGTVNGVSFSGPQIAGSLALLMSAFPNLSGVEALQILYETARDLGEPGVDDIYGHGVPDMAEAFAPQGQTRLASAAAEWATDLTALAAAPSGAYGDWAWNTGLFDDAVLRDDFNRVYSVGALLEQRRPDTVADGHFSAAAEAGLASVRTTSVGRAGTLALRQPPDPVVLFPQLDSELQRRQPALSLNYRSGPVEVAAGRGFAAPGVLPGAGQPVLSPSLHAGGGFALGLQDSWSTLRWREGRFGFVIRNTGNGEEGARSAAMTYARGEQVFALELGSATEAGTAWGGSLARRFGYEDRAETQFQALAWSGRLLAAWRGSARVEIARSEPALPEGLSVVETPVATAWSLGAERPLFGGALGITLDQPLRAERGRVAGDLAVGVDEDWNLVYDRREGSLSPSGREVAGELSYRWTLAGATLAMAARYARQPDHVAAARNMLSVWLGLRARY